MKNKFVLNFWYALLLLICIKTAYILFYVLMGFLFKTTYTTESFVIFLEYVSIFLFVPFIFWLAKKTDTNFKKELFIPNLSTVIKMIVVIVLAQTIVLSPLSHFEIFVESLRNSKLRIAGTEIKPLIPILDLRMIFIVPIIEELFFRGLVLKSFLKMYSPAIAILLSSLLFSVHHFNIDTLIYEIILGILLGVLYYKTNSLIIIILAHVIWNALCLFQFQKVELDMIGIIIHLLIYISASTLVIFLLNDGIKTARIKSIEK